MRACSLLHLLLFVFSFTIVWGDVEWAYAQTSTTVHFGEKATNVQYRFTNTGTSALTILEIYTDCDCTQAHAKDQIIAAGGSSEIEVHFTVGAYSGLSEKNISVRMMDDTGEFHKTLKLTVNIPVWIRVTPPLLMWPIGSLAESTSEIYVHPDLAGHRLRLVRTPAEYTCVLSPDPDNRSHYLLKVTPNASNKPCHHELQLSLDDHPDNILAVVITIVR